MLLNSLIEISLEQVFFLLFILANLVHLYFILGYFTRLANHKESVITSQQDLPTSVIIAAKNEAENLKKNLPSILQQLHSNYEVIVINDHSNDETLSYLASINDSKLEFTSLSEGENGKKQAIQKGIHWAKNDCLVFTDADCKPSSEQWLSQMSASLRQHDIVLGIGKFYKRKGLLNQVERCDALHTAMLYCSFTLKGVPYMGVGRNMAYSREVYQKSSSFERFKQVKSGDDDLLINEMARQSKVGIMTNPLAYTFSEAETSWSAYLRQKIRQMEAGKFYRFSDQMRLATYSFGALGSWWLLFILLLFSAYIPFIFGIFVFKLVVQMLIMKRICVKLEEKDLWPTWPFLEFIYFHWTLLVGASNLIVGVKRWK